ncbi:MAG: hypothetical protein R6X12_05245 [bacterium]
MLRRPDRLLLGLAGLVALAGAWTAPVLSNVSSSAPPPGGTVVVQADIAGPVEDDNITAWVNWSTNAGASWSRADMARLALPGWDSTWQGGFTLPGSGTVLWYVQSEDGANWATQGPKNAADAWPPAPALLAPVAFEPAGDMVNNPPGNWLDLTDVRFGISDAWIYARVTNNHTSWPVSTTIPLRWYLYAVGFRNPDAAQDTFSFVLAYGNILGLYQPGLYVINGYTSEFERVGDIEYNTAGNVLSMRCRIADLATHPKFGPWPIPSGHLRAARGDTRSVDINQNATLHDTSNQSRWYVDRSPGFVVGQNRSPVLSLPTVVPRQGGPSTEFAFSADYTDPDTNLPVLRKLVVGADTIELVPNGHRWHRPVVFGDRRGGFAPGVHRFHFLFSDGLATVTSGPDSFVVTDTTAVAELPPAPVGFTAAPNPFRHAVELLIPPGWQGAVLFAPSGRLVRRFLPGRQRWDGTDESGRPVPSGVYFLRAGAGAAGLRLLRLAD